MKVVISSEDEHVTSGVPQGTVLGPDLFLIHIKDLPSVVNSQVRLFADDCLLYRPIKNIEDQIRLQEDIRALMKWASDWGMTFNAKKCYIMSVKKKQTLLLSTWRAHFRNSYINLISRSHNR